MRIRGADGAYRWFRTLATPLRDDDGQIVEWFGTSSDVDDRKRAGAELRAMTAALEERVDDRTRELQAAKKRAESADRLKTDFIMSMSHELRTTLNAIIGFSGTLLMRMPGPLTAEQEHQLRLVQSNGRHLLTIISDVLDVARIEAGALQILINLTSNAIKFTERGGVTVTLEEARRDDVEVIDVGGGRYRHRHRCRRHPPPVHEVRSAVERRDNVSARDRTWTVSQPDPWPRGLAGESG